MKDLLLAKSLLAAVPSLVALIFLGGMLPGQGPSPETLTIGVMASTFPDQRAASRRSFIAPFNSLIQSQTGLPSRSVLVKDVWEMEKKLQSGEIHVGVLNGFEFAWIQEKNPNLKPLVITVVRNHPWPVAHLVACHGSPIAGFGDLKEKKLSLPLGSRAHVRLYLERAQSEVKGLTVCSSPNIEDGLDEVVTGEVAAAVVDDVSLVAYKAVKPGCYRKLKFIQQSPVFPAGVVIYKEGSLDGTTIRQFAKGLLAANKNPQNQLLMSLFRLSAFEPVPESYSQVLSDIRKRYPAPSQVP